MDNILYFACINQIGGVETFYYYLAKKYGNRDITVFYKAGDEEQIKRLRQMVRVRRYRGETIKCKRAFFNYRADIIDNVEADEYIQIIHANYGELGLKPKYPDKIDRFVACSKTAAESFTEVTGFPCEVVYNPIAVSKQPKMLRLISATRLTKNKGKDRLEKLARALEESGIPYTWEIFTNDKHAIPNRNIVWRSPELDILPHIARADYLVQLSDTEGYCYSVVEALTLGTPVIVTPCEVYKEIGLDESNSFTVDFDMKEIPVKEIYKGLKKFKYEPPEDKWGELLTKGKSKYSPDLEVMVKCIRKYYDVEKEKSMNVGETFATRMIRAEMLIEKGLCEYA